MLMALVVFSPDERARHPLYRFDATVSIIFQVGFVDVCPVCCFGSLAQNFIDAVGASELGALLMHTSTLTQLDLSRAGMTNSCVFSLSKALAFNRCLCCKHYDPLLFALSLLARYSCHPTVLVVATRPLSPFVNV